MKKLYLTLFILIFGISLVTYGQDEKFKALFMYNFTKYLEWPATQKTGDFIIAVFGNSPIVQELEIIAQKRSVGNQSIVVRKYNSPQEISRCHILFIPESKSSRASEIAVKCADKGTLIITDQPGLGKSVAGINYIKINGKQNFEINRQNIESKGLKVNSALLSLGVEVQ